MGEGFWQYSREREERVNMAQTGPLAARVSMQQGPGVKAGKVAHRGGQGETR